MSRRRQAKSSHQLTIHLSPEDMQVIDQWQNNFGMDTRAAAAIALLRAGASAVPLDTAVYEISRESVRAHQKYFTDALANFFEQQTATLKGTRP